MVAKKPLIEINIASNMVYMPGELVKGTVKSLVDNEHVIELVSVNLFGESYIIRGEKQVSDVFLTENFPLDYKGAGEGNYEMSFSLPLKSDVPASVATTLGGIRYGVSATMIFRYSNKLENSKNVVYFSVIPPVLIRYDMTTQKEYLQERGLLTCCMGSVSADLEVIKTSLLCGECSVINARVINGTNAYVVMTSLSLVQKVLRKTDGKIQKNKVAGKERGCIMPGKQQVWLAERFLLPSLPPSTSNSYFDVSYKYVLEIQKTTTKTLKIKIPITVGNMSPDIEPCPKSWNETPARIEFWNSEEDSPNDEGFKPVYVVYNAQNQ